MGLLSPSHLERPFRPPNSVVNTSPHVDLSPMRRSQTPQRRLDHQTPQAHTESFPLTSPRALGAFCPRGTGDGLAEVLRPQARRRALHELQAHAALGVGVGIGAWRPGRRGARRTSEKDSVGQQHLRHIYLASLGLLASAISKMVGGWCQGSSHRT